MGGKTVNITKEFLIEEYINKSRLTKDIAEQIGVGQTTVYTYLRKYSIKTTGSTQNLVGKTFGYGTVVRYIGKDKHCNLWLLKCECGKEYTAITGHLNRGRPVSCGCRNKTNPIHKSYKCIPGWFFRRIEKAAENRSVLFNVSIKDLYDKWQKQNGKCALSNIPLTISPVEKGKVITTASLDRIDSSKGYVKENIQWVHKHINVMKLNHVQDYFIELCKAVAENNN